MACEMIIKNLQIPSSLPNSAEAGKYRPFLEARAFVHTLNLKSTSEWSLFSKSHMLGKEALPADIPATPNKTYAQSGRAGMSDWPGNDRKPRKSSPI